MTKFKTNSISLILMAICISTNAQQRSSVQVADGIVQLCKQLDTVIAKEHIPGLMVAIVKKDSILFAGGFGYANLDKQHRVDGQTQFHLASITKFFVAMGIQQMIAKGKLKLEDRIRDIAPEIPFNNPWETTDPVRVVHLLEHTAGFEDVQLNSMINISGKPLHGIEAVKAVSNSLTARWKPGTMMSYSNPGYNVLGYILEKVSAMPWDKHLQESLFAPLGMKNSLFDLDAKQRPNFAVGYNFQNGKYKPMPLYLLSGNGAASALVSNAEDMASFMHYLLNGSSGGPLLDSVNLVEMETIHSTLASNAGLQTGYALGNELFPNNKKISFRGHNGKGEGFVSWIFFNREAGLAYTIAANSVVNLWPVSKAIEDFITKDLPVPELVNVTLHEDDIRPMLGYYQFMNPKNERWDFYRRIWGGIELKGISNNKLVVDRGSGQIDSLIHVGAGLFRLSGNIRPSFILARDPEGIAFFQGYGNDFYRKVPYASVLIQKTPLYLGGIAILLYLIYGLLGICLTLFRRMKLIDLCIPLFPVIGTFCFIWAYRIMGQTDASHKELFASMNSTSFSIFAGMLLFAVLIIISCFILYIRWTKLSNRWIRVFFTFNNFFLCYLVATLVLNGWIGVPIWMM